MTIAMLRPHAQMAQGASFVLVMLAMRALIVESLVQTLSTVGWMTIAMPRPPAQMAQGASRVAVFLAMRAQIVESLAQTL
jgi:hypothetical protein